MLESIIAVLVDNARVDFPDVEPVMRRGRVLVPMRSVFEKLGATVMWRPTVRAVTADRGATHIEMALGARNVRVNSRTVRIDQAALVINGRMMVPLRFVSETMGAKVHWDADSRTVHIDSSARS